MATKKRAEAPASTALALVSANDYAIATGADAREVLAENMGGQKISAFDLERVTIPAAGATEWQLPNLEGTTDGVKELVGIPIYFRDTRVYWEKSMSETGGGSPPDCFSDDGFFGHGKAAEAVGGSCEKCPFSKFGSGKNGGQACKQVRILYILRADSFLPMALALPPTSIQALKKFFLKLAGRGVRYSHCEIKLTLERLKNSGGIAYSHLVPALSRMLDPEAKAKIDGYVAAIRPQLDATKASDVAASA